MALTIAQRENTGRSIALFDGEIKLGTIKRLSPDCGAARLSAWLRRRLVEVHQPGPRALGRGVVVGRGIDHGPAVIPGIDGHFRRGRPAAVAAALSASLSVGAVRSSSRAIANR